MLEKAKQMAEVKRNRSQPKEEASPLIEGEKEEASEVVLTRA